MTTVSTSEADKIKRLVNTYNMLVNLFWTFINVVPVAVFCYLHMNRKTLIIFLCVAFLFLFIPVYILDKLQLKNNHGFYEKIGVTFIARFTQNGTLINRILRKRYPGYNVVTATNDSIKKLLNQTYAFERFHYMFLVFFILATGYAVVNRFYFWACIITITNVVYNIYPILLQHYVRTRLRKMHSRFAKRGLT